MSAFANQIVINQNGSATILERIPLAKSDGAFSEQSLQQALFNKSSMSTNKRNRPSVR